jgi:peptide/nickel transport system substrate-binding protein
MVDQKYQSSRQGSRVSRRTAIRGAALGAAGLATLAAIGCGQQPQQTTTPGQGQTAVQAKRGGILRRSGGEAGHYDTRGAILDPHQLSVIGSRGYRLMYQGLLAYDPLTLELKPELAQKWEQRSQTEFAFTLAQNVKWHNKPPANGRLMTAQDVVFSIQRAGTKDPKFVHSSLLNLVDKIEAADNSTVRITLKEPDAALLDRLSSDGMMILAPEVVEKADKFATADEVVGTGAFIMKSTLEKVNGEYVRNPDYWKPGLPYLDGILTPYFSSDQLAFAAFLGGQLDATLVPGQEAKKNATEYINSTDADWFPQDFIQTIQQNVKVKPFDDERVWKAMKLLIDHDELKTGAAEVWYGRGRHGSILPPSMTAWDFSEEEYSRMLEWRQPKDQAVREAMAMLSAAGYNASNPVRFAISGQNTSNQTTYAELLQAGYRRLSQNVVNPDLRLVDFATSSTIRAQRAFDMYQGGHAASISEPDTWFTQLYVTGASRNYANFSDPRLDQMVARQRTIFDVAQRRVAVKEIIQWMIENTPFTSSANHFAFSATKPTVKGWVPEHYTQGNSYETLWLDV